MLRSHQPRSYSSRRRRWYSLVFVIIQSALLIAAGSPYGGTASSSTNPTLPPATPAQPQQQQQQQQQQSLPRSQNHYSSSGSGNGRRNSSDNKRSSPWNPSPHIDDRSGFLNGRFVRAPGHWEQEVQLRTRYNLKAPCRIRQVPGDGNCLFHSISLCLCEAVNGTHWNLSHSSSSGTSPANQAAGGAVAYGGAAAATAEADRSSSSSSNNIRPTAASATANMVPPPSLDELYAQSQKLRADAVACLRDGRRRLVLQGRETLRAAELVQAAAHQYGLTAEAYCQAMRQDCVWGGGPEIVALSNLLERPIHVYELATVSDRGNDDDDGDDDDDDNNKNDKSVDPTLLLQRRGATGCGTTGFVLRRMACFGSPKFDRQKALHILSADSRFPDIRPGQQLPAGNHFLAVFPDDDHPDDGDKRDRRSLWRRRRKRLRGGDIYDNSDNGADDERILTMAGSMDDEDGVEASSLLGRVRSKCRQWWSSVWFIL